MLIGYNTNGFAHHRWQDALELLAAIGYQSVAITVDHHCLDPQSPRFSAQLAEVRSLLEQLNLRCVIETGARFLLNPQIKHEPTLLTADPAERWIRLEFLRTCVDIAAALQADAVSFWSGVLHDSIDPEAAFDRLVEGCGELLAYSQTLHVRLAFEPEPGMLIETMDQYADLAAQFSSTYWGLTIDVGHLQCSEEEPIPVHLRRWREQIFNIHIEDMRKGVHEHLRFGEGEIDFPPVISTLREIGYTGGLHVELSRHSHCAPGVAAESFAFLNGLLQQDQT